MKRSNPKLTMTRRAAQVLAAIVFWANRHGGKVPDFRVLASLISPQTRKKGFCVIDDKLRRERSGARDWLKHFRNQHGYFIKDPYSDEKLYYLDYRELATTPEEAVCIMALHRAEHMSLDLPCDYSQSVTSEELTRLTNTALRDQDFHRATIAFHKCRAKRYILPNGEIGFICSPKALRQLPYLRLLARNFQPVRRQIVHR